MNSKSIALCLVITSTCFSQLQLGANTIENSEIGLSQFKAKVLQLESGRTKKVFVTQIGDSHIQPNNFSGIVRAELQKSYGNGGRGLSFPYSLANTNGPKDYTATSSVKWTNSWITHKTQTQKIGLTGIGVMSIPLQGSIELNLQNDTLKNPYTRGFIVFTADRSNGGSITVNNTLTKSVVAGKIDTIQFVNPTDPLHLSVRFAKAQLQLLGVYTQNDQSGLLYNSVGTCGATFANYWDNPQFLNELSLYRSDLIIFSLGTNESYSSSFNAETFAVKLQDFILKVKKLQPSASILFTLPSENYFMKETVAIPNKRVDQVSAIITATALMNGCAIWDLKTVMGGTGSMLTWKKEGLVNDDHVHYLRKGYNLQGRLLAEAIKNAISAK